MPLGKNLQSAQDSPRKSYRADALERSVYHPGNRRFA